MKTYNVEYMMEIERVFADRKRKPFRAAESCVKTVEAEDKDQALQMGFELAMKEFMTITGGSPDVDGAGHRLYLQYENGSTVKCYNFCVKEVKE